MERVGRVELHSAQLGRLASHLGLTRETGAVTRNRTPDLLITNQLLYQLSYDGWLPDVGSNHGQHG
jgi:hypothetical protein